MSVMVSEKEKERSTPRLLLAPSGEGRTGAQQHKRRRRGRLTSGLERASITSPSSFDGQQPRGQGGHKSHLKSK